MSDVHLIELAGRQYNRVSRAQLQGLGYTANAIQHRLDTGRLVVTEPGVLAVAPVLDDDRGRWMEATLTAPETYLSRVSGAAAYRLWSLPRDFETVTRPGNGGPCRHGNVLVFRSETLADETTFLGPIPITTPERVLLDLATFASPRALARAVREAVRLAHTTPAQIFDCLARHWGERGTGRLRRVLSAYAGLPLHRARSGAEVQALLVLRDAGREMPVLNRRVAGIEADLVWPRHRLIIELDGGPFHLDVGEDARKEATWRAAGWRVERLPSEVPYEQPERLLLLAPPRERR
jgi:hypothetical protein